MKPAVYLIERIGSGSLSMMAKPAGGEQSEGEFKALALAGITTIVSLLETHEAQQVGLQDEEALTIQHGMQFRSFPIKDFGTPPSKEEFRLFSQSLYTDAAGGENIVVHCRAGIGRSGLMVTGVLLHGAFDIPRVFDHISEKRGETVPETHNQINWLTEHRDFIVGG